MMFGSIPQQDVFQRITSAKNEATAVRGSVLGGSLYFGFAFVPMFLAYAATLIDPHMFGTLLKTDSQLILPTLILQHTPLPAQIIFFGAVLSAIMSCSSATLLAPSVAFSENIIKGLVPQMDDRTLLRIMRLVLVCFAGVVLIFALNSQASIFKMVESAYKVTLVAAFIPLVAGLYWRRANTHGAKAPLPGDSSPGSRWNWSVRPIRLAASSGRISDGDHRHDPGITAPPTRAEAHPCTRHVVFISSLTPRMM